MGKPVILLYKTVFNVLNCVFEEQNAPAMIQKSVTKTLLN